MTQNAYRRMRFGVRREIRMPLFGRLVDSRPALTDRPRPNVPALIVRLLRLLKD